MSSGDLDLCERLAAFDTPTVANAVETFGVRDLTEGYAGAQVRLLTRGGRPVVGYAVTVTFDSTTGGKARPGRWFELMDALRDAPKPAIVVSQYVGSDRLRGCWMGDIIATLLSRLGAVGTLTDTAVRDLAVIEERLPAFGVFGIGSVASHGNGGLIDVGVPVAINGLRVRPGDLLHGDPNGIISIPRDIAADVPVVAARIAAAESDLVTLMQREPLPYDEIRDRFAH
jgi:regulator of RNase E activity RraA